MLKKICLFLLLVFITSCTGLINTEDMIKNNQQIKEFMKEYPNAELLVVYLSKEQSLSVLEEIKADCGNQMLADNYYKVSLKDPSSGLSVLAYLSEDAKKTLCFLKKGGIAENNKDKEALKDNQKTAEGNKEKQQEKTDKEDKKEDSNKDEQINDSDKEKPKDEESKEKETPPEEDKEKCDSTLINQEQDKQDCNVLNGVLDAKYFQDCKLFEYCSYTQKNEIKTFEQKETIKNITYTKEIKQGSYLAYDKYGDELLDLMPVNYHWGTRIAIFKVYNPNKVKVDFSVKYKTYCKSGFGSSPKYEDYGYLYSEGSAPANGYADISYYISSASIMYPPCMPLLETMEFTIMDTDEVDLKYVEQTFVKTYPKYDFIPYDLGNNKLLTPKFISTAPQSQTANFKVYNPNSVPIDFSACFQVYCRGWSGLFGQNSDYTTGCAESKAEAKGYVDVIEGMGVVVNYVTDCTVVADSVKFTILKNNFNNIIPIQTQSKVIEQVPVTKEITSELIKCYSPAIKYKDNCCLDKNRDNICDEN